MVMSHMSALFVYAGSGHGFERCGQNSLAEGSQCILDIGRYPAAPEHQWKED